MQFKIMTLGNVLHSYESAIYRRYTEYIQRDNFLLDLVWPHIGLIISISFFCSVIPYLYHILKYRLLKYKQGEIWSWVGNQVL